MSPELAGRIPGASSLIAWFGHFPSFHDGTVLEFALDLSRGGRIVIEAHRMSREVDDNGFFVLDKHCVVTFLLKDVRRAEIEFDDAGIDIVFRFKIAEQGEGFGIDLESVNGCNARLVLNTLSLSFEPQP